MQIGPYRVGTLNNVGGMMKKLQLVMGMTMEALSVNDLEGESEGKVIFTNTAAIFGTCLVSDK